MEIKGPGTGWRPTEKLLDSADVAGRPSLRHVELNRAINRTYGQYAEHFQRIVDPAFDGSSGAYPTWYAVSAYSSKTVGKAEWVCGKGVEFLDRAPAQAGDIKRAIKKALPIGEDVLARLRSFGPLGKLPGALVGAGITGLLGVAAAFSVRHALDAVNVGALADPDNLPTVVWRLAQAGSRVPESEVGPGVAGCGRAALDTLRNTLEEANRAIFEDLGVAGHAYLAWRPADASPERTLRDFSVPGSDPDEARQVYDFACLRALVDPAPFQFHHILHGFNSASYVVASFALYERAGQVSDHPPYRDRLIEIANNLLLFREQFLI
ncbi:MAG: hypothetical protein AB1758_33310, partial [Candidatus Eremiobacterota bacterium]